ncbi:hypothetical protein EDC94DRAFT_485499, partial [Helicostylum pulchrum]
YKNMLSNSQYIQLNAEICSLLNQDWGVRPHMKFSNSQLLANAIIYSNISKEIVLINTFEVYGRRKLTDSHRESFKIQKGQPPETSLPLPISTKYPNVWPTIIHDKDRKKLVIGAQTFNALITSSLKIDNTSFKKCKGAVMN